MAGERDSQNMPSSDAGGAVADCAHHEASRMEFLYAAALELVAFPAGRDIYPYIADRLNEMVPGSIVAVTSYDDEQGLLECHAVAGFGKLMGAVLKLIGRNPVGMRFPMSQEALEGLCSGRFVRLSGGIAQLTLGQIPEPACRAIEKLIGVKAVHAMGVMREGRLLGSAVVIQRRDTEFENRIAVETFVGLASVALQRRAYERALCESERKYRAVVENTNDIVFSADSKGQLTYVSPQVERFGLTPEEACKMNVVGEFVLPEDRERVALDLQRTMTTGDEFPTVFRARDKDGCIRWLEDISKVQRDEQGEIVGITGVLRDITERKQAEEALRLSEKKYRDLVEHMTEVLYALNAEGTVTYASPAVRPFIGYEPSEVIGKPLFDFVHREDLAQVEDGFRQIMSGRARTSECRILTRSGGVRWVRTSSQPVVEDGRVVGLRGILVDITAQRLLENSISEVSIKEQRRMGRELHDGLGQELRAIAFKGQVLARKLAAGGQPGAAEAEEISTMLEEAVGRTQDIVRVLNPVGPEEESLAEALAMLAASVSSAYGISCAFESTAAVEVADPTAATHIFRIAQEAVGNALRHAKPRSISITFEASDESAILAIKDDGGGLPEGWEDSPGMGLKTMRHRSRMIGGSLAVESRPGGGTTVKCSFPLPSHEV